MGLQYPDGFAHSVFFETGQPVDTARNIMVSNALQRNVSHVFFLDQDIILKPDTLLKLWDGQMPICSAVYFSRAPPYNVVANIKGNPISRDDVMSRLEKAPNHQALMEVHETGAGALLVDMRVFKRIAQVLDLEWYCLLKHPTSPTSSDYENNDDTGVSYTTEQAIANNYRCNKIVGVDDKGNQITCDNTIIAPFFDYRIGKQKEDALSEDYYFNKLCRNVGFSIYLCIHNMVEHEIPFFTINENGIINSSVGAGILV